MKNWILIICMVAVLLMSGAAMACPMCSESVANTDSSTSESLPAGFNYSIYAMLLGLFGVMGLVVRTIVKGARQV